MKDQGKVGRAAGEQGLSGAGRALVRWRMAQRWRRAVDEELRPLQLSLTRWLALDAIDALTQGPGDAVSQREIAEYVELGEMMVSRVLKSLEEEDWVSRGPSSATSAYRVILTATGEALWGEGWLRIEAATLREPVG